jgi:hypothetical protein
LQIRLDKVRLFEMKRRAEVQEVVGDAWQTLVDDYSDDTESDYNSE